ncbi:hypothetical protein [Sporocytophaga myxococcoides]|nr:hypothetical protein [Sporocytophaga myxococcoides]
MKTEISSLEISPTGLAGLFAKPEVGCIIRFSDISDSIVIISWNCYG